MKQTFFLVFASFIFFLISCSDDDPLSPQEQLERDIQAIDAFLESNNIIAQEDPSGLRYVIHDPGTGTVPDLSSTVTVNFVGKFLTDGSVFDEAQGITFPLNQLILGWQIGIPLIGEGGSITLYIPSGLGFGPQGTQGSPPNANLIFDIDLLEVE